MAYIKKKTINNTSTYPWQDGDFIEAQYLNNIEDGIAEISDILSEYIDDLDSLNTTIAQIDEINANAQQAAEQAATTQIQNLITSQIEPLKTDAEAAKTAAQRAQSAAEEAQSQAATALSNAQDILEYMIGSTTVPTDYSQTIAQQITTAAASAAANQLGNVATALGTGYEVNQTNWTLVKDSINDRLDDLSDAIGGAGGTSLASQIQALNEAIFGTSSGSTSGTSLIDKIERALGRTLDSFDDTVNTTDESTASLYNQIKQIKAILSGDDEGTPSQESTLSLTQKIAYLIHTVYNNDTPVNNLTHTVENLFTDFYDIQATENYIIPEGEHAGEESTRTTTQSAAAWIVYLTSAISSIKATNSAISQQFEEYAAAITRSEQAYIEAELDDSDSSTNYLVLKRDLSDSTKDTRIPLPAGGGQGGGTAYDYTARFVDVVYPTNTTINLGDACNIVFTWRILDENGGTVSNIPGNLTLRINGATYLTQVINSNEVNTINLGSYITTTGRNTVAITVTSDLASAKTLYTTITAYNAVLTSSFNANMVQTGSLINFPYVAAVGSASIAKTLFIFIDGQQVTLTNNVTTVEQQNTVTIPNPGSGDHVVTAYFTAKISDTLTITSNTLAYGILCGTSNETRIASDFIDGTQVEQYNTLTINYLVVTPNQIESAVEIYVGDKITPSYTATVPATYQSWSYQVNDDIGSLTIRIVSGNASKTLTAEVIANAENYDFSLLTSGLQLYLTADQRSNTGANVNVWENSSPENNAPAVSAQMNNFFFYGNVDGWQQDSNGQYFLRLRNQATVTIPYSLFNLNISGGQIVDGLTFEVDFRTSDVTDYGATILQCLDILGEDDKYITLTPQNALIHNNGDLSVYYKEDEKITLDIVINPSKNLDNTVTKNLGLYYIYLNGILSAVKSYSNTALNFSNLENGRILLGSSLCTTDIYSIKVYNRVLNYKEIIKNWVNNTGNFNERINRYRRNNYSAATITFNEFLNNSPNTPYMVITGPGALDSYEAAKNLNEQGQPEHVAMPESKDQGTFTENMYVRFIDPLHPELNFTTEFDGGSVGIAVQGTSSQAYYRKNYKIKLSMFQEIVSAIIHKKKISDSDYETVTVDGEEVTRLKSNISAEGYRLRSTSYPTFTFCIKADVASSESVNNTGLVHFYDDTIRHFVDTPPQVQDERVRQGVEGYPMVCWYYDSLLNQYTFMGKYNFNNDKGTEEVYGFVDGDESWEVKHNLAGENPLVFFNYTDENWNTKFSDAFESRFPDDDDYIAGKKTSAAYTPEVIEARKAGLKQLVKWVSETVQYETGTRTLTAASREAFAAGFPQYFNLTAMLFFYTFTELFLMVDNRAKNMFMTRYIINSERSDSYTDTFTGTTVDTNILDPNNNIYFGWFTLPYDFDTALGIDNNGVIKFDYHYEDTDLQPNGSVVFNGQLSKLWVGFKQVYADQIAEMYRRMVNYLSYSAIESYFEQSQSIWSEAVFNEDMIVKYINWADEDIGYPMLNGSKTEQRKWWLSNRFKYFNSKYALDRSTDNINMRIQSGAFNIPVEVFADAYVSINLGAQGTPQTVRVLRGETGTLVGTATASTTEEQTDGVETYLSPASSLKSVANIADLQISTGNFSNAIRLQELRIGSAFAAKQNARLRTVSLNNNTLLRHLDLRYCTSISELNLSNCLSLMRVYLSNTALTSVNLPNGGILETIQYPTTISSIIIQNQPYFKNLIIGTELPADEIITAEASVVDEFTNASITSNYYSNISSLYLANVGTAYDVNPLDTLTIVQQMPTTGYLHLENIEWTIAAADFFGTGNLFEKLDTMRGFTGTQTDSTAPSYLQGKLRLTNATGITEEQLLAVQNRFNDLEIVAIIDGQERAYHRINFYDFSNRIYNTQIVIDGQNAIDPFDYEHQAEYSDNDWFGRTVSNYQTIENGQRVGFKEWDTPLTNITQPLNIRPRSWTEYLATFYVDNGTDYDVYIKYYPAYDAEENNVQITGPVTASSIVSFTRNYYDYRLNGSWSIGTENGTVWNARMPAEPIVLYAQFNLSAHEYTIRILNTNSAGQAYSTDGITPLVTPIGTLKRYAAIAPNTIAASDLASYLTDTSIAMIGADSDIGKQWTEKTYKFLNWSPYIDNNNVYTVTGDADILLMYYYENDIYTNYFTNKLVNCKMPSTITQFPRGAFLHNSALERLETDAINFYEYSCSNFGSNNILNSEKKRIFIFQPAEDNNYSVIMNSSGEITNWEQNGNGLARSNKDLYFYSSSFQLMHNAIIIFNTTGTVYAADRAFYSLTGCTILSYSLTGIRMLAGGESAFQEVNNNTLSDANRNEFFVTPAAYTNYYSQRVNTLPNTFRTSDSSYSLPTQINSENLANILANLE